MVVDVAWTRPDMGTLGPAGDPDVDLGADPDADADADAGAGAPGVVR